MKYNFETARKAGHTSIVVETACFDRALESSVAPRLEALQYKKNAELAPLLKKDKELLDILAWFEHLGCFDHDVSKGALWGLFGTGVFPKDLSKSLWAGCEAQRNGFVLGQKGLC